MGKNLTRAIVVTVVLGVSIFGLFLYWKDKAFSKEAEFKLNKIESLEAQGLPSFKVKSIDGSMIDLDSFKGKPIIVNFWASWCAPCLEEMPSLISLVESKKDIHLFAISGDSDIDDIQAFIKSFPRMRGANIHIVWDEDKALARSYDVDRLPESFVGDKSHKLVKKIVGTIDWFTPDSTAYMESLLASPPEM